MTILISFSKNLCGPDGLAAVLQSLSYSSAIKELLLSSISLTGGNVTYLLSDIATLSKAMEKLFELTVSLKKV